MKNRKPLPAEAMAEVAEVRAEVQRALALDPPDLGVLATALERVDTLIEKAQDELIAAVRELQSVSAAPQAGKRGVRNLLPW